MQSAPGERHTQTSRRARSSHAPSKATRPRRCARSHHRRCLGAVVGFGATGGTKSAASASFCIKPWPTTRRKFAPIERACIRSCASVRKELRGSRRLLRVLAFRRASRAGKRKHSSAARNSKRTYCSRSPGKSLKRIKDSHSSHTRTHETSQPRPRCELQRWHDSRATSSHALDRSGKSESPTVRPPPAIRAKRAPERDPQSDESFDSRTSYGLKSRIFATVGPSSF